MSDVNEHWAENIEIQIFQEYLRIPTVHPNVDYSKLNVFIQVKYIFNLKHFKYLQNHV